MKVDGIRTGSPWTDNTEKKPSERILDEIAALEKELREIEELRSLIATKRMEVKE